MRARLAGVMEVSTCSVHALFTHKTLSEGFVIGLAIDRRGHILIIFHPTICLNVHPPHYFSFSFVNGSAVNLKSIYI